MLDINQTRPADSKVDSSVVARHETFDVLSILRNRRRNVLHLPSSPLPSWSVMSPGTSNTAVDHCTDD